MTDWDRVDKLREQGKSWSEIAADPKVDYKASSGTDPARSLKTLYLGRRRQEGERRGRRKSSSTEPKPDKRSYRGIIVAAVVMVAVVGSVAGYLVLVHPNPPSSNLISYCGGEGQAEHYHILLIVIDSGSQQPLPYVPGQFADVGYLDQPGFTNSNLYCPNGGIHALHTHDGSGIIHAELPPTIVAAGTTPKLADFFTIWGEPLDSSHVWTFSGKVTATMLDLDTKHFSDWSSNPGSIPLYTPAGGGTSNAYAIPQSWIFNAQYGGGSSGGTFGGEMIWLNITPTAGAVQPIPELVPAWHGGSTVAASTSRGPSTPSPAGSPSPHGLGGHPLKRSALLPGPAVSGSSAGPVGATMRAVVRASA